MAPPRLTSIAKNWDGSDGMLNFLHEGVPSE